MNGFSKKLRIRFFYLHNLSVSSKYIVKKMADYFAMQSRAKIHEGKIELDSNVLKGSQCHYL